MSAHTGRKSPGQGRRCDEARACATPSAPPRPRNGGPAARAPTASAPAHHAEGACSGKRSRSTSTRTSGTPAAPTAARGPLRAHRLPPSRGSGRRMPSRPGATRRKQQWDSHAPVTLHTASGGRQGPAQGQSSCTAGHVNPRPGVSVPRPKRRTN